jgi:hypothetical protein
VAYGAEADIDGFILYRNVGDTNAPPVTSPRQSPRWFLSPGQQALDHHSGRSG